MTVDLISGPYNPIISIHQALWCVFGYPMTDHRFISHLEVQLGCRKESRSDHFQVSEVNEAYTSLLLRYDGKSWKTKNYFVYKIILCLLRENQTCLEKTSGIEEKHSRLAAVYQKILPLGKINNQGVQKELRVILQQESRKIHMYIYTF